MLIYNNISKAKIDYERYYFLPDSLEDPQHRPICYLTLEYSVYTILVHSYFPLDDSFHNSLFVHSVAFELDQHYVTVFYYIILDARLVDNLQRRKGIARHLEDRRKPQCSEISPPHSPIRDSLELMSSSFKIQIPSGSVCLLVIHQVK